MDPRAWLKRRHSSLGVLDFTLARNRALQADVKIFEARLKRRPSYALPRRLARCLTTATMRSALMLAAPPGRLCTLCSHWAA
ncbi:hypothetical protein AURDEDRAFT_118113 [Auricularia subglabra TFB-10046 SS5]|uniref:Uncharacterized protein n=1 Tax=Auricularia subglabra (strain TFB-10046 / SS5) TaxID=717982 RepID=J0WKT8_AURST|nr:hypothetical protein AURDEDRAFT_118113 [Auricularia subglabra TFB-10046 SS5]